VLLAIAIVLFYKNKAGKLPAEPSGAMRRRLRLGNWQLFGLGAVLVAIQSVVDVVFVIAMIRVGQLHQSGVRLVAAVATYAVAALVLQIAVVVAYWQAPDRQKQQTLRMVHRLLTKYANEAVIGVSFVLGCALLLVAAQA
jgi:fumarate reductase subunit D